MEEWIRPRRAGIWWTRLTVELDESQTNLTRPATALVDIFAPPCAQSPLFARFQLERREIPCFCDRLQSKFVQPNRHRRPTRAIQWPLLRIACQRLSSLLHALFPKWNRNSLMSWFALNFKGKLTFTLVDITIKIFDNLAAVSTGAGDTRINSSMGLLLWFFDTTIRLYTKRLSSMSAYVSCSLCIK